MIYINSKHITLMVSCQQTPGKDFSWSHETGKDRRWLNMKPGFTCPWQVNGRSDTPFEEWMELDMKYIDNWSIWLDVKILFMTIPSVLKGSGAS